MMLPSDGSTEFIRPHLDSLVRMRERGLLQPDVIRGRAERLLRETFGETDAPIASAFAIGHVGIIAEHTYYFDGFALLLPLPFGTAVAVRQAQATDARCVMEGSPRTFPLSSLGEAASQTPSLAGADERRSERSADALRRVTGPEGPFQVAVVSEIPSFCEDGYFAALALAARRAMVSAQVEPDTVRWLAEHVGAVLVRPYGVAPILGAAHCEAGRALLVDTSTTEHIHVDLPDVEQMVCALVDMGVRVEPRPGVYGQRRDQTAEVVEHLRKIDAVGSDGIRDLEHRHLQLALKQIPRRLQPVLRYLVTENRRVQRLVVALRQADPQMFGAFLQMSQAAIFNDWKENNPAVARVQALADQGEGVEGVRRVGREFGSGVLLSGRPLAMMPLLDLLTRESASGNGPAVHTFLL